MLHSFWATLYNVWRNIDTLTNLQEDVYGKLWGSLVASMRQASLHTFFSLIENVWLYNVSSNNLGNFCFVLLLTHWALDHMKQNVVWYNNSWLGFLKNYELCTKRKRKIYCKHMSPHLSQLNVAMANRNYYRQNNLWIVKLATYTKIEDHYFRCKLATL